MKNSFWLFLILAMGMPTAWGQQSDEDLIGLKVVPGNAYKGTSYVVVHEEGKEAVFRRFLTTNTYYTDSLTYALTNQLSLQITPGLTNNQYVIHNERTEFTINHPTMLTLWSTPGYNGNNYFYVSEITGGISRTVFAGIWLEEAGVRGGTIWRFRETITNPTDSRITVFGNGGLVGLGPRGSRGDSFVRSSGTGIPIYLSPGDYRVRGRVGFDLLHFEDPAEDEDSEEQSENYAEVFFHIQNGVPPNQDFSVDYTTVDGTATAGQDYVATSGTINIPAGTTNLLHGVRILIIDDNVDDPETEIFHVDFTASTNAVFLGNPNSALPSITAQEDRIHVVIADTGYEEPPTPIHNPVHVNNGGVTPIIVPHLSQNGGSSSSSLMFQPTSLSLSESGSATYQVRATALPTRDMTVNLETSHSGITLDPSRLVFTADTWQDYQTVTVTANANAADIGEQTSIRHSIPNREGFVANNNAGTVFVTLAHTVVEAEEETPEPPTNRQPVQQVQVPPADYDQDDNGLIEVGNLAQLNAIRFDLNGDGQPDQEAFADDYALAFPSAIENLKAQGYELADDLDFGNNPTSWESIGVFSKPFQAVFEGNGHTIYNLYQDQSDAALFYDKPSGLFGSIGHRGQVVNLGLEGVRIKGVNRVGALAGFNQGSIGICSAQGQVEGVHVVGGLVGQNFGDIVLSLADVEVNGVSGVDDLVGIDSQAR